VLVVAAVVDAFLLPLKLQLLCGASKLKKKGVNKIKIKQA
jgi:hypothetical protein